MLLNLILGQEKIDCNKISYKETTQRLGIENTNY